MAPEPTRYQDISPASRAMLALGESGRFEFKRDSDAVTVKLLATLANWVALDASRDVAHLLVGVDEEVDEGTGLVIGRPYGLPKGLDRTVSRIQDMASKTRPIPVDVFIVEEGVALSTPFVRVEVRPTMPPHFDDEGRRQTRQGRSTRALTDEELLSVYLDRESGSFAARFRQTTSELRAAVDAVADQVSGIADDIERDIIHPIDQLTLIAREATDAAESASLAAESASASADSAAYEVGNVDRLVRDLQEVVGDLVDESPTTAADHVLRLRREVWGSFSLDTYMHDSDRATRIAVRLRRVLTQDISVDPALNSWELAVWRDVLRERKTQPKQRGTQKWWKEMIKHVEHFSKKPSYSAPDLPDIRAALRVDEDKELDDPASITNEFFALLKRS